MQNLNFIALIILAAGAVWCLLEGYYIAAAFVYLGAMAAVLNIFSGRPRK